MSDSHAKTLAVFGGLSMAFIFAVIGRFPPDLLGLVLTVGVGVAFGVAFYWGLTGRR